MIICRGCSSVEPGIKTIVEDFETYDTCARCDSWDILHIDEDAYQDRLKEMPYGAEFFND